MSRLILVLFLATMISCKSDERKFDTTTYEKTKESLEEKEKKSPARFLSVTSSDKRNIIGQTVIRGSVYNRASVCTYKDVEVKIAFFSKTGVLLEENKETIYEIIPPNNSVKFKSKYFAPKGTDSMTITVLNAKVEGK
jgi:hypothetical protein